MSDIPELPDEFDERARAAGRALRQPAPADGLRRVQRGQRNRRIAQVGGTLAVAVLGIGGIVAIVNRGDDTTTITTVPPAPTVPVSTPGSVVTQPPPSSVPGGSEPPPPSSAPPSAPPTSTPGVDPMMWPGDLVSEHPTVWLGEKYVGSFDGDTFVEGWQPGDLPDGVLGTTLDLLDRSGGAWQATTLGDCSSAYLAPRPDWDILAEPGTPLRAVTSSASTDDGLAEMDADLGELGIDPATATSYGYAFGGAVDRLVLVDGWTEGGFEFPTWIATWDSETGEFTTIEGDQDPANALDIGVPADTWLDVDADDNWEIAFAVGDGWVLTELATRDQLAAGDVHPCPDGSVPSDASSAPEAIRPLLGEWAFTDSGDAADAAMFVEFDGTTTFARYSWCQDEVRVDGDAVTLAFESPQCGADETDPRAVELVEAVSAGRTLVADGDELRVGSSELRLVRADVPAGLDLSRASIGGLYAGQYVPDVEGAIAKLIERFGPPSHDTGWFITPPPENPDEPDCLADMTTRTAWWGDLAVSFWPDDSMQGGTVWNWTLGATANDVNVFADVPYTPTPSGITTVEGFGVGTPSSELAAFYGDEFPTAAATGSTSVPLPSEPRQGFFANWSGAELTDGFVTSLIAQKSFC